MRLLLAILVCAIGLGMQQVWADETQGDLEKGIAAFEAKDFVTAKSILLPLAEAGNPRAQGYIGYMTNNALEFEKDPAVACDWYEKSARQGNHNAQFNLATCYLTGSGRPNDLDMAIKWFSPLAQAGDVFAQYKMGLTYFDMKNTKMFLHWMTEAAKNGSAEAKFVLRGFKPGDLTKDMGLSDYACVMYAAKTGKPFDYCDK